ncbi:tail protein X, partial [Burkholderia ambifaria]
MEVRALQGETIDALCWRVLGRTRGVVEAVLDLNRDLAQYGPILPHG